jgi:predicted membrane-bound spermidine synthase
MLEISVFLCGAVVMVIELTGSRVLAPYLGTSLVVWTSLIGIILASLSLGYWWGGRVADRRPEARLLGRIILLAAVATAAIALTKSFVLGFLQSQGAGLHAAAVWSTLLLFAPPSVLLGMVAPFAVRLKIADTQTSGRTAGNLYAISTIGSIVGTFFGRLRAHRLAGQHEYPFAHGGGAGHRFPAGGAQRRAPQGSGLRLVFSCTSCGGRLRCSAGSRRLR